VSRARAERPEIRSDLSSGRKGTEEKGRGGKKGELRGFRRDAHREKEREREREREREKRRRRRKDEPKARRDAQAARGKKITISRSGRSRDG